MDFVKKEWQFRDIISENELNRMEDGIEEGITKAEQAQQTAGNAASAASAAQATANSHASRHASGGADPITPGMIGAETPAGAQAKVDAHANATSVHGATSAATANRIVMRDGSGNIAVGNATADDHALNRITGDGRYVGRRGMLLNPGTYDSLNVSNVDFVMCKTDTGDITINSIVPSAGHRVRFIKYNTAGTLTIKQNPSKNMYMADGKDLVLGTSERYGFAELHCDGTATSWYGNVLGGNLPSQYVKKTGDTINGILGIIGDLRIQAVNSHLRFLDNAGNQKWHLERQTSTSAFNISESGVKSRLTFLEGGSSRITEESTRLAVNVNGDRFDVITANGANYILTARNDGTFQFKGQNIWHAGNLNPNQVGRGVIIPIYDGIGLKANITTAGNTTVQYVVGSETGGAILENYKFLWDAAFAAGRSVYFEAVLTLSGSATGYAALRNSGGTRYGQVSVGSGGPTRVRSGALSLPTGTELFPCLWTSDPSINVWLHAARLIIL